MTVSESIFVHTTSIVLSVLVLVLVFYIVMYVTGKNVGTVFSGKQIPGMPSAPVNESDVQSELMQMIYSGSGATVQF